MSYTDFLATKRRAAPDAGISVPRADLHESLFPFQLDLVAWALRKGRAALFADTGLGKTRMQVEWARQLDVPTLILAPLAVAHQTIAEAARMGITVTYARDQGDVDGNISITNYERLHKFDPAAFQAVVLDESSILKSFSGTTKRALVAAFKATPYRLCCTATPAPNDIEELCNHADFLSVMTPQEMRSTYFIADSREFLRYRLKGHARESFYRWLASWAAAVQRPSDLGYPDEAFELPPLDMRAHIVHTDWAPEGKLFSDGLNGIGESSAVRRATLVTRVARAVELIRAEPGEAWLAWCGLNDEQDALAATFKGEAVSIDGRTDLDERVELEASWRAGERRVLITKPAVFGFGMNWQHCARMTFVGLGYSYEQYYQAVRRCWRFGQVRPVHGHIVVSEPERDVLEIVQAKEAQARKLTAGLLTGMTEHTAAEIFGGTSAGDAYEPCAPLTVPAWLEAS